MKAVDKLLLGLLLLAVISSGVFVILLEFGLLPVAPVSSLLAWDMPEWLGRLIITMCAILIIFITLRVLVAAFILPSTRKDKDIKKAAIVSTDLGVAYITIDAVRTITKRFCLSLRFVYDCVAEVVQADKGVIISAKITPYSDTRLPEVVASLQSDIKETVETTAGINVIEVHILVLPPVSKKAVAASLN